jgi:tripartite-type tricarboxylate transporter receptor subunit TctC
MATVLFCRMAGVDMVHVPYKGSGPAVADLIAGQVQLRFSSIPPSLPHVKSGRLRALAVTSAKRFGLLPGLPAVAETVPGFEVESWYGFLAPARTPEAVIRKINADVAAVLKDADVKSRLEASGAEAVGSSPARFGEVIRAELKRWGPVVKEAGGVE